MKGNLTLAALAMAAVLTLTGFGCAGEEPPPNDGRVRLYIKAADPNGGALKFLWVQVEGPPVTIADPTAAAFDRAQNRWVGETYFIPKEPGKYVFEVTVTNEEGEAAKRLIVQEILRAVPPPQADAGPDQKVKVGETVLLNGMNSKAFEGRAVTQYQWGVKAAPPGFTLDESKLAGRQLDFKPTAGGKYVFELKVFDGKRWGEPVAVEVDVKKPAVPSIIDPPQSDPIELPERPSLNNPPPRPRADAGEGRNNLHVGDRIVLDGSASRVDPRDKPQFVWIQKDTARSPFVRRTTPDTTKPFDGKRDDAGNYPVQYFTADAPGVYKFVLQITTEGSAQPVESSEVVNVVIGENTGPIAPPEVPGVKKPVPFVTATQQSVEPNEEVRIDASKSISPSGAPLKFLWMQVPLKKFPSIRGQDGPVIRVSGSEPGEYWVQPVVSDGVNDVKGEPIIFTVVAAALPPIIETERTRQCNVKDELVLKAKVTDPAGLRVDIKWSCIDPPVEIPAQYATQPQFRFQPNRAGTWLFRIEATNSKGLKSTVDVQVGVRDPGVLAPTAMLVGPERATVGDSIVISGVRSADPAKNELAFKWSEETEGGPKIQTPVPGRSKTEWRFAATEPGRIIVTLVVNNGTVDSVPAKWAIDVAPKAAPPPPQPPDNAQVPPPNPGNNIPPPIPAKPIASITGPKTVPARIEVELSGEGSASADGGQLSYSWSQLLVGGAPDLNILPSQSRGRTLRFTPLLPGTYTLTLEVSDRNQRRSDEAKFILEVTPGAGAPVAPPPAAAPPRATAALISKDPSGPGREVRMSARGSADPAGGAVTYKWMQTKGPQPLPLVQDNTEEVGVTPTRVGAYEFELVVSNAAGMMSAPAQVAFTVAQPAASARAVIGPVGEVIAGDRVVLDGTGSTAQNGAQLIFQWRQVDNGGAPVRTKIGDETKPKFEFIVQNEGKYLFELKVSDGNDWSAPVTVEFTAKPRGKNAPPVAVVGKTSINCEVDTETVIDASGSSDPDNGPEPLTFRWKRDGAIMKAVTGPVNKFTPPVAGKMTITVEAFDGSDFSEPATVQVNVMAAGALPVAVATVSPNPSKKSTRGGNAAQKFLIVLDGTGSRPDPEKIVSYTWTQISGDNLGLKAEQLDKVKVGLYIFKAGAYRFQLVVSDGTNTSKPTTVDVQVEEE